MAASGTFKQEMPPKGGYKPIDWQQRIPRAMSGPRMILAASAAWGFFMAKKWYFHRFYMSDEREMNDSRVALIPFYLAERQREEMVRYRENRDYENDLMKDVEGWVTGTLYGEKVYVDDDRCYAPGANEYLAHNHWLTYQKQYRKRLSRY